MRLIILFTFFLAPLFGLASFPIENETAEFINEVYNQTSLTETPWYNKWWAILLNIIMYPSPLWFLAVLGILLRLILLLFKIKKSFWKKFFKISKYVALALLLFFLISVSQLK